MGSEERKRRRKNEKMRGLEGERREEERNKGRDT